MAKPVIQTATSASPRGNRVPQPTKPWVPSNLLAVTPAQRSAHPGMHPRWIRKGKEGDRSRIDEKLAQGYVLDQTKDLKTKGDPNSGSDITGATTRRDCVLMWLPDERKQARDYHQQELDDQRRSAIDGDHENRVKQMGGVGMSGKNALPAKDRALVGND